MPASKGSSGSSHRPSIHLGIDPGGGGGLAALFSGGKQDARPMPATEADLWAWFAKFRLSIPVVVTTLTVTSADVFATIEQVHSMPRDGHSGAFSFGKSYGLLIMALTAAQIPYEQVRPQEWQKGLDIKPRDKGATCETCGGKGEYPIRTFDDRPVVQETCIACKGKKKIGGESETQWKNRLKAKAQQLFPQQEVTLATADALLIAEFGRRKRSGTL